jgi:hypothetical protein
MNTTTATLNRPDIRLVGDEGMNKEITLALPKSRTVSASAALPVDIDCLKAAASEDRERLKRIIDLFLVHTAVRLDELKTAINQDSASDVCAIAHKSLGSSRTCGMNAIVPALEELERISREGHLRGAEDHLTSAQTAFEDIKSFLGAICQLS